MIKSLNRFYNEDRAPNMQKYRIGMDLSDYPSAQAMELLGVVNVDNVAFIQLVFFFRRKYNSNSLVLLEVMNQLIEKSPTNRQLLQANVRLALLIERFLSSGEEAKQRKTALEQINKHMVKQLEDLYYAVRPHIDRKIKRAVVHRFNSKDSGIHINTPLSIRTVKPQ